MKLQATLRQTVAVLALTVFVSVSFLFALFAREVASMGSVGEPARADAIIVLTGGRARLEAAGDLLKRGKGERLLVSGVNSDTSGDVLQDVLGVDQPLFDCCVDLDRDALDTVGNARESAQWVIDNRFDTVIIVTNDYHMLRAMNELQRALPETTLIPAPVVNRSPGDESLLVIVDRARVLTLEFLKYALSLAAGVWR